MKWALTSSFILPDVLLYFMGAMLYCNRQACMLLVLAFLGSGVLQACGPLASRTNAGAREPIHIIATIAPLADWSRQVGGERVQVTQLVPTGQDPRRYSLRPDQQALIKQADIIFLNGLGLEPWLEGMLDGVISQASIVINVSQYVQAEGERTVVRRPQSPLTGELAEGQMSEPESNGETVAQARSPYLWLSPDTARQTVNLIAQTLHRADRESLTLFRQNAARYSAEIDNLDNSIQRQFDALPPTAFADPTEFTHPYRTHFGLEDARQLALTSGRTAPWLVVDALLSDEERLQILGIRAADITLHPLNHDQYLLLMQLFTQQLIKGWRS